MPSRLEQFQALVEQHPENELFRFSLAQSLIDAGRDIEAIPHLEVCIEKKSDWMMPLILLGKIHLASRDAAQARPLLEAALQLAIDQQHEDPEAELRGILGSI